MIRALLVDDEINNLENLSFLLENDCEEVKVAGKATNAGEARAWLSTNIADVVFLDINMPGETGLHFLQGYPDPPFKVVFVTAYDQYALQAIKASALDYIVKPVRIDELQRTITKIRNAINSPAMTQQHHQLLNNFLSLVNERSSPKKIALPHLGGISFIEINDIVSLQADSNYTILHLTNMQKIVITKTLKDFEELLDEKQFARIHKSYIVNLRYIKEYSTTDGGIVKMTDGNQWSISRRQLDIFLEKMKGSSLMFGK